VWYEHFKQAHWGVLVSAAINQYEENMKEKSRDLWIVHKGRLPTTSHIARVDIVLSLQPASEFI
jgi:hypothetical protein